MRRRRTRVLPVAAVARARVREVHAHVAAAMRGATIGSRGAPTKERLVRWIERMHPEYIVESVTIERDARVSVVVRERHPKVIQFTVTIGGES